jgi:hypothetical protein
MNHAEIHAEVQRLREERRRFEIEQLIVDIWECNNTHSPEWSFAGAMDQAVARVQKFLDDHR